MSEAKKETLYIDVEDEITAVIEKVVTAKPSIIAVVLPKRATVFQSSVNMKLLQKAATSAKKNIVLITSDPGIMAIAATADLHVAKTPTSKPTKPSAEKATTASSEPIEAEILEDDSKTVEENKVSDDADSIELDNTEGTDSDTGSVTTKKKKKKMLKIPDFSSFRLKMGLAILTLVTLIVLWVFGFVILPKAVIEVNTDISKTPVSTTIIAKTGESPLDLETNSLPSTRVQVEKVESKSITTTGQKNVGEKATGTMNLENCINDGNDKTIPAGTSFSSGSQTFVTTEAVTLSFAVYAGNSCLSSDFNRDKDVGVIATQPGPEYNLAAKSYTSSISGINATGSAMSGGTSQVVTIVSNEDVEKAVQELGGASRSVAIGELKQQLSDKGLRPIEETLVESTPKTSVAPAVGEEAASANVTYTITYSLIGLADSDIAQIIEKEVQKNLEGEGAEQNVRDSGVESVVFKVLDGANEAAQTLSLETVATIGPDIDVEALRNQLVGMKRGDIQKLIEAIDGVRSVNVEYSPAWITTTPKSAEKIDIIFNENNDN